MTWLTLRRSRQQHICNDPSMAFLWTITIGKLNQLVEGSATNGW